MSVTRTQRPVVDPGRCETCGVCEGACPGRLLPGLAGEAGTVRGVAARLDLPGGGRAPCEAACPLGQGVREYVEHLARGRPDAALDAIRRDNPLPRVTGYLCHRPCEGACVRTGLDGPVAVRALKLRAASQGAVSAPVPAREARPGTAGARVAVVGSGPAGLAAAWELSRAGCRVTLVEADEGLGGMLRSAIPAFRLPPEALERDLSDLASLGWEVRTGCRVEGPADLAALGAEGHEAVLLALGAAVGLPLAVPGWGGQGCLDALAFLRRYRRGAAGRLEGDVVVVGGGNVALDAARAAVRCGASRVCVVYRRGRAEMPADPQEVAEAEAEGVELRVRALPTRIELEGGRVTALVGVATRPGPPDGSGRPRPVAVEGSAWRVKADWILAAVGQRPDHAWLGPERVHCDGRLRVGPDGRVPGMPGVFGAGDGVAGPTFVTEAMASGREAARRILEHLEEARDPSQP